jgi:predicted cupin superfamily sugar epimerase/quercetin dioxygenase-like cupin family protein
MRTNTIIAPMRRCLLLFLAPVFLATSVAQAEPPAAAQRLIDHFKMQRIPQEGGWFAEFYRGPALDAKALPPRLQGGGQRSVGTSIYALVTKEDFSAMHKLETDEIWQFYSGDPLKMLLLYPDGHGERVILGPDPLKGHRPQFVVPHGVWMGARPGDIATAGYTLFGCVVVPGFEFSDFQIGYRDELQKEYPTYAEDIQALTREEFASRPRPSPSVADVFKPDAVKPVEAGPGIILRELIGRAAQARTERCSIALFSLDKGCGTPTSYNKIGEETFLVTRGSGRVVLDGRAEKVSAGSVVVIKAGVRHLIEADAAESLEFYAITAPAFSPDDYVAVPGQ